jgi:hypothetical protein
MCAVDLTLAVVLVAIGTVWGTSKRDAGCKVPHSGYYRLCDGTVPSVRANRGRMLESKRVTPYSLPLLYFAPIYLYTL